MKIKIGKYILLWDCLERDHQPEICWTATENSGFPCKMQFWKMIRCPYKKLHLMVIKENVESKGGS